MYEYNYSQQFQNDAVNSASGGTSPAFDLKHSLDFKRAYNRMMTAVIFFPIFNFVISYVIVTILGFIGAILGGLGYIPQADVVRRVQEVLTGTSLQAQMVSIGFYILTLLVPFIFFLSFSRVKPSQMMSFKVKHKSKTLLAIISSVGLIIISGIVLNIILSVLAEYGIHIPETPEMPVPKSIVGIIINFIYVAVVAAFVEEFVFRGVVLGTIKRYSKPVAIVVSAVIFGLIHGNPSQSIYAIVMGLIVGYYAVKYETLWVGIGAHLLNNALYGVQTILNNSVSENTATVLLGLINLLLIAAGIAATVVLRIMESSYDTTPEDDDLLPASKAVSVVFRSPLTYVAAVVIIAMMILN